MPLTNDALDEDDEILTATLSAPAGATLATNVATVTLTDDDPTPSLSVADVTVGEGAGNAAFVIQLSAASGRPVTVSYATADGTATAGTDYSQRTGSVTIPAGSTTTSVSVPVVDDATVESGEQFLFSLNAPINATIADAQAVATITDNDVACSFTISPTSASYSASASSGTIGVTASASTCGWTASSSQTWVTLTGGAAETGNGTVSYSVAANTGTARTATITAAGQAFTVSQAAPGTNAPPTVTLTAPASAATYTAPANVTLTATAADSDGTVTQVAFYQNGTLISTDTTSPYSASWNGVAAGTYSLTAVATDNQGATTTSAVVSITVNSAPAGETVLLDDDFNDNQIAGQWLQGVLFSGTEDQSIQVTETSQRLQIGPLATLASGSHYNGVSSAQAYNFTGGYAYVALVQPASATSVTYTMFTVGTDSSNYYRWYVTGTNLIAQRNIAGTKTDLVTLTYNAADHRYLRISHEGTDVAFWTAPDTGSGPGAWTRQTAAMAWDTHVPLTAVRFELKAGTSSAQANPGSAVFDTFHAAVPSAANQLPTVALTAPANGAQFTAPATIALQANAIDPDGSIAQVQFFAGSSAIGTVSASPYTVTWSNVQAGTYSLTAVATDNRGGQRTSAAVTITVQAPSSGDQVLLEDRFDDNVLGSAWARDNLFSGTEDPAITVAEQNQRIEIGPLAANATGSHYNGIATVGQYDFTGAYAYVELLQPASTSGVTYTMFTVGINNANYYRWYVTGTQLIAQQNLGGTKQDLTPLTYVPADHRFLRISHEGSDVVFSTAPGSGGVPGAWTERSRQPWSGAVPLTAVRFELKAGTSSAQTAPGTAMFDTFKAAVPTQQSETEILTEDFSATSLDATKWSEAVLSGTQDAAVDVAQSGGLLQIGPLLSGQTGSHYNGILSQQTIDLTGAYASVQAVAGPNATTTADAMFTLPVNGSTHYRIYLEAGTLHFEKKIGGVKTAVGNPLSYVAADHAYWRIRHRASDDTIVFETAPAVSGAPGTWTPRASTLRDITITGLKVELKAGTYQSESTAPGTVQFDNVRVARP